MQSCAPLLPSFEGLCFGPLYGGGHADTSPFGPNAEGGNIPGFSVAESNVTRNDAPIDGRFGEYPREAYVDEWTAFDLWIRRHSPDVKAFELLEWVDLGETRSSRDGVDGWIDFTDGVHPGNDSRFTDVDHLGASILQHRLNELNMGIEVALA